MSLSKDDKASKGMTQTYGIDCEEAFAPVAKMKSVCLLLSIIVNLSYAITMIDLKSKVLRV